MGSAYHACGGACGAINWLMKGTNYYGAYCSSYFSLEMFLRYLASVADSFHLPSCYR